MAATKEELIKIRVVQEGAAEATTQLEALNKARRGADVAAVRSARSIKAVGAAAKTAAPALSTAAASTTALATAQTATGLSSKVAQTGLTGVMAAAQPMTLALGGASTAMGGLAAASRVLGTTLATALGPIGLIIGAIGMIGSAIVEVTAKKKEDEAETRAWAREYQERSREVVRARDEVVRAHEVQIETAEAASQTAALEHELELLELVGASTLTLAEKREEIHASRMAELETSGDQLRTERQLSKLELERAESALKRLQSEKNKVAAIEDSKTRTEQLRAIEEQILEAQEGITAAIANQNAVREKGVELTAQQLELDRKREVEKLKETKSAVEIVKTETVAAYTGAKDETGSIPQAAFEGSRNAVLAAGGTEADVAEVHEKLIEGTYVAKPRSGGSRKPKKEEKVEARFGDYRDVLRVYAESRAGVDAKALHSLAKGTMPKDHRPETSIQITNHITNTFDSTFQISTEAGSPQNNQQIAREVDIQIRKLIDKTLKQTSNGLVR